MMVDLDKVIMCLDEFVDCWALTSLYRTNASTCSVIKSG